MTASIWLRDVFSYGLQLTLIIATGAALAIAFRLREPTVTLAYWRTLLMACLMLPLCQPWLTTEPLVAGTTWLLPDAAAVDVQEIPSPVVSSAPWPLAFLVLLALVTGIAMRLLWLALGVWTLARLRRTASPLVPLPDAFSRAKERVGVRAGLYVSDRIAGPVTFGLMNPVVMVPPSVVAMRPHVQEAIAYHELLHVRRRDWLFEVIEEGIRTVFWFHPAIWWLIGRIQLSREQVVDQAAIRLTESKERYLDALLAVARTQSTTALVPAPLFLRRRLLKKRVAQILQESTMTTRRLIASLTASAAALVLAATVAVRSFPLEAQGQDLKTEASTGQPIQIVKGGEHLLHASLSEYPRRAIEQKVQGDVLLELVTDERGEVADARVLSGPDELRRAALESVLQWHYSPNARSSTSVQATLRFRLPAEDPEPDKTIHTLRLKMEDQKMDDHKKSELANLRAEWDREEMSAELSKAFSDPKVSDRQKQEWKELAENVELLEKVREEGTDQGELVFAVRAKLAERKPSPFEGTPQLVQIKSERVTSETMKELVSRAGIRVGDPVTEDAAKRLQEIATSLDEHLRVSFRGDGKNGLIISVINP